jgi:hypothetical protein
MFMMATGEPSFDRHNGVLSDHYNILFYIYIYIYIYVCVCVCVCVCVNSVFNGSGITSNYIQSDVGMNNAKPKGKYI